MTGIDGADSSDVEEDRVALDYGNVPDLARVTGQWVLEDYDILALY